MKDINPTAGELETLERISARNHTGGAVANVKDDSTEMLFYDTETGGRMSIDGKPAQVFTVTRLERDDPRTGEGLTLAGLMLKALEGYQAGTEGRGTDGNIT